MAIYAGNFYQVLLGCNVFCGHNKGLSLITIVLTRPDYWVTVSWSQHTLGFIAIAQIEPHEAKTALMVGSSLLPPPLKPAAP